MPLGQKIQLLWRWSTGQFTAGAAAERVESLDTEQEQLLRLAEAVGETVWVVSHVTIEPGTVVRDSSTHRRGKLTHAPNAIGIAKVMWDPRTGGHNLDHLLDEIERGGVEGGLLQGGCKLDRIEVRDITATRARMRQLLGAGGDDGVVTRKGFDKACRAAPRRTAAWYDACIHRSRLLEEKIEAIWRWADTITDNEIGPEEVSRLQLEVSGGNSAAAFPWTEAETVTKDDFVAECRADERRTQAWFDAVQQPLRPPPCCELGCGGCCTSLEHHNQ